MLDTLRKTVDLIGRDHRARWILLVVMALVASGFEMLGAALVFVLMSLIADPAGKIELPIVGDVWRVAEGVDRRTLLLIVVAVMGVFFVLRGATKIGSVYIERRVAVNAGARLSNRLVEGYYRMPYSMHLRRTSAELIRNGHQAVQQLVNQVFVPMIRVVAEAVLIIMMLGLTIVIAPMATLMAVLFVGGTGALLAMVVQPRLKRLGRTAHEMQQDTLGVLQQTLHGIRDVKVLGRERYFARRYGRSRLRLARTQYLKATVSEIPSTMIELGIVGFILVFFVMALAGGGEVEDTLSVLGLLAYVGFRLQPSVQRIIRGLNDVKYATAPLDDLYADLKATESLPAGPKGSPPPLPFADSIALEGVAFGYEGADADALADVELVIRAGEQIGICGPTGGGKTTLVDLITGLLVPTRGRITVDGMDLGEHAAAWQRNLGVVPQMVFLIDDTLRRNIALGVDDADIDEVALREAVELAQLTSYVESLPAGLDTEVGERGVRISGGQRQRIAIARALYRRPAVLIFDEGTSALDNATEARLMEAIERLRGGHTIILVAHRLSTVRNSDRIVFVDRGRISATGSYGTLIEKNPAFRAMAGDSDR